VPAWKRGPGHTEIGCREGDVERKPMIKILAGATALLLGRVVMFAVGEFFSPGAGVVCGICAAGYILLFALYCEWMIDEPEEENK